MQVHTKLSFSFAQWTRSHKTCGCDGANTSVNTITQTMNRMKTSENITQKLVQTCYFRMGKQSINVECLEEKQLGTNAVNTLQVIKVSKQWFLKQLYKS